MLALIDGRGRELSPRGPVTPDSGRRRPTGSGAGRRRMVGLPSL